MSRSPDFFIVGAPKCGTTSLYSWLREHPDIFMPEEKEPHYFAQHLSDRYCRVRNEADYLALFKSAEEHQLCGEASVLYGFYRDSIKEILAFNPEAKIIFMIRNPVDMVQSYHGQLLVNLEEDVTDFEKAWHLQEERKIGKSFPKTFRDPKLLQYRQICALGMHLRDIFLLVPEAQRHVVILDDLAADAEKTYTDVLDFLGLKDDGRQKFDAANEAAALHSPFLQRLRTSQFLPVKIFRRLLKKILPSSSLEKLNIKKKGRSDLSKKFKQELQESFESDIKVVEDYLKRDFPHWRNI